MSIKENNIELILANHNIKDLKKLVLTEDVLISNKVFLNILIELYGRRLYFFNKKMK
jgi:hypothetical protein